MIVLSRYQFFVSLCAGPLVRAKSLVLILGVLLLLVDFGFQSPQALAADEPKKTEKSSSKKTESKDKKKSKDKHAEVEPEKPIGADSKNSKKEFDAELEQGGKIDAVILLDSSRSMLRTDPQRLRDQAAKLFLRFLTPGDRVAVFQFDRDAKLIQPFVEANEKNILALDQAIAAISNEGAFTDLEAPIAAAEKLLSEQGRKEAIKTVILFSDGKMDPHPSRGTSQQLVQTVRESDLANYRQKALRLYTLSLSEESDKELLAEFAKDGGGVNWYAPDATTVHKKFSELFLTLKRPQVVPLEGEGFEVDQGVQESTFYITRESPEQSISLVNPQGTEISAVNLPPTIKWFRGDLFDVITVPNPMPGRWGLRGLEKPEGFATLLSDIKLQVRWPQTSLKLGDSVTFQARLTNKDTDVSNPGFEDITFYTYKIVNAKNGEVALSGALNDKGEDGDEKSGDTIYSATAKLEVEGEFQALFAVTSPTFTRQQRISFTVSEGLVVLRVRPADEHSGVGETIVAELSSLASELKNVKVQLVAKKAGENKPLGINLTAKADSKTEYPVPVQDLEPGEYQLYAKLSGTDSAKKPVTASSETLHYAIAGTEEVVEHVEEGEPSTSYWIAGILSVLLAGGWMAGLYYFGLKRVGPSTSAVAARAPFVVPEPLTKQLEIIRQRSSKERRAAGEKEALLFALVAGDLGNVVAVATEAATAEQTSTTVVAEVAASVDSSETEAVEPSPEENSPAAADEPEAAPDSGPEAEDKQE